MEFIKVKLISCSRGRAVNVDFSDLQVKGHIRWLSIKKTAYIYLKNVFPAH